MVWTGNPFKRLVIASAVEILVLVFSFVIKTKPVFLSTIVLMPGLWSLDSTVSLSQSPILALVWTIAGRVSMSLPGSILTLLVALNPLPKRTFLFLGR